MSRSTSILAMGEGDVDFDGIFETLREIDFANRQLRADATKVGGDNIACIYVWFSRKNGETGNQKQEKE